MSEETGFSIGDKIVLPTPDPEQQPAGLRFSERMELAKRAVEWCTQHEVHEVPTVAHNIITALDVMNLIKRTAPTGLATASEFEQLAREYTTKILGVRKRPTVATGAIYEATTRDLIDFGQKVQELTRKEGENPCNQHPVNAAAQATTSKTHALPSNAAPTVQPAGAATADTIRKEAYLQGKTEGIALARQRPSGKDYDNLVRDAMKWRHQQIVIEPLVEALTKIKDYAGGIQGVHFAHIFNVSYDALVEFAKAKGNPAQEGFPNPRAQPTSGKQDIASEYKRHLEAAMQAGEICSCSDVHYLTDLLGAVLQELKPVASGKQELTRKEGKRLIKCSSCDATLDENGCEIFDVPGCLHQQPAGAATAGWKDCPKCGSNDTYGVEPNWQCLDCRHQFTAWKRAATADVNTLINAIEVEATMGTGVGAFPESHTADKRLDSIAQIVKELRTATADRLNYGKIIRQRLEHLASDFPAEWREVLLSEAKAIQEVLEVAQPTSGKQEQEWAEDEIVSIAGVDCIPIEVANASINAEREKADNLFKVARKHCVENKQLREQLADKERIITDARTKLNTVIFDGNSILSDVLRILNEHDNTKSA